MYSSKTPISIGFNTNNSSIPLRNPVFSFDVHKSPTDMWRNVAKQISSRGPTKFCRNSSLSLTPSFLGFAQDSFFPEISKFRRLFELNSRSADGFPVVGFQRKGDTVDGFLSFSGRNQGSPYGLCCRSYASVAEAVEVEVAASHAAEEDSSSVDAPAPATATATAPDEDSSSVDAPATAPDEVQELLDVMMKEERNEYAKKWRHQRNAKMGNARYCALKKRQVKIETEAWQQAAKEYGELLNDMCKHKLAPNLPYMKSLFLGWFEPLREKIAEEQELIRNGKSKAPYAKYFDLLPADMMAVITMHKLTGLLMTGGEHGCARVVHAACTIGEAIEQEVRINYFLEKTKKKKAKKHEKKEGDGSAVDTVDLVNAVLQEKVRKNVTTLMKKQNLRAVRSIVNRHIESQPWGQDAKAKVGSHLIELILETAYIQPPANQLADGPPDIRPAFVHTSRTVSKEGSCSRRYGVIECDPLIRKGLEKTARHMVIPYMPMLVHPVKWTKYDKGAYIYLPSYVMRTHGARQQRDAIKRTPGKQLKPVFEALDTLGSTKWRVNKKVLNIIDKIWANGGRLGDLVDRSDIPLPEEPDTEDETLIKKWRWKFKSVKKENSERHSQRCDTEIKLAVARKLKEEEGFFYPHNLDFRGRAYPMHPNLNHLGSDICRGILEFSEGRPLGKSGLRWLKIHLANLFANGVDKLSHDGRLAFTENHMDDIFDSADSPLEGKRWWLNAEDPFQCLAACINLAEALRSPSPERTLSHIPVHQDGSCNGLQHYAALGRDKLGAAAVNLVAGEKPADVYSGIAARYGEFELYVNLIQSVALRKFVRRKPALISSFATEVLDIMKEDAQKDPDEYPEALHARRLIDQVDRKLVKQTVMTSVYGVTYIGARDQIKKRLKERGAIEDDAETFGAACYAAKVTLTALGQMFESARSIMSWLGECAKVIASENEPVRWTTPLGLPVVQPYHKVGRHFVKTSLQVLTLQRETETVMGKRQRTAFPPNFVHSLDGSHMMMTAIACRKAGLNFAGVHDSYWTHACDVDVMNKILREKFVELYETPVLENLLESFEQSFPSLPFPPLPERGDFELRDVLESPYFFN